MAKKKTDVEIWLERETKHIRQALENASTYFDDTDVLNVYTLEAVYAKESSFGILLNERGITQAAGQFHFRKATAGQYGLIVSKENDQRFDIDYASIAAARYLKDLDYLFSKRSNLGSKLFTIPVVDSMERAKFDFASYNAGQGTIAKIQNLAQEAGKDPAVWDEVKSFLGEVVFNADDITVIKDYVVKVVHYETEFAEKSLADKDAKDKKIIQPKIQCTKGHWITKDNHHIFICE